MNTIKLLWLQLLWLCLFLTPCASAENRIELSGVTGERKQNVELYLQDIRPAEINPSARFKRRVHRDIQQALRGLGYYQAKIDFEDKKQGKDYILHAKITANYFVFIDVLDLRVYGGAANDTQFLQLLKNAAPKKGERLHHGKYENYKAQLISLANRKGFFDAKFERTELIVTPGNRRGIVKLYFNSGQRYKFGEISFHGSQINQARLRTLLHFRKGDHYSARLLGELSQALAATQWFGSINLEADVENRQNGILPLRIELTPAVRNILEVGGGFATDIGPRIKANWQKPWLNQRGHSLNTVFAVSKPEQRLQTSYKLPLRNVTHDYYQYSLAYNHLDDQNTDSTEFNLVGERNWLLKNGWTRNASLRYLYEDFIQASQQDASSLILPGLSLSKGTSTGENLPMQADYYLFSAEASQQSWGSDTDFIRLRARAGWIGSFSAEQRWLFRLESGVIFQANVLDIPPSLRFFAGGDNSLRGFKFKTVAPIDENEQLIGGTRLLTANLEYQYRLYGDWWLALFTDAGSAWNEQPDWQQSIGFGARWASPIGPVRFDLGFALRNKQQNRLRLHFTLGPEL